MDERTLTALKASVAHWEQNAEDFTSASIGSAHCPLCRLFHDAYRKDMESCCKGCPVKEHTGRAGCKGTPYDDAHTAFRCGDATSFYAAAAKEVAFLKSLLPGEV